MKGSIIFMMLALNLPSLNSVTGIDSYRMELAQKMSSDEPEAGWHEHRSSHFLIYYKDAPMDFVRNVEQAAENYYEEIRRNLGFTRYDEWSFDQRAKIYIYRDQDDYVNSANQAHWSHGAANAQEKIIRTFPSAHGFFDSTLPHELGHIIFREFIGFEADIPSWLDEGVAMFQEKAKRWGAHKVVKQAMEKKQFLSIPDLFRLRLYNNTDQDTIDIFYAESASIVYYLIMELGEYRFVQFCRNLKEGKVFDQALSSAYGRFDNLDDLNQAWVKYLENQ